MDSRAIGVFDSGLGGLSVVRCLKKKMPGESLLYFGDSARTPYGSKAVSTIRRFSEEIISFLVSHDVKAVVIACNTVSSTCLEELHEKFPELPIVGIIEPVCRAMAEQFAEKTGEKLGIIGTKVTVESGVYPATLQALAPDLQLVQKACPLLVPLIEEGLAKHEMVQMALHYYLDDFVRENRLNGLILGCTHYPLIRAQIEQLYPDLSLYDPAEAEVDALTSLLAERDALAPEDLSERDRSPVLDRYYASDLSENYMRMIREITEDPQAVIRFRSVEPGEL